MRGVLALASLWFAALPAASPLHAQQNGAITGSIRDFMSDVPVPAAIVTVLDARGRRAGTATADSTGSFTVTGLGRGEYRLRAAALGYREVTTPAVQLAENAVVDVIVRLSADAIPLAPLEVVTRPQPVHTNVALAAFTERAERRMGGAFMLRQEIEDRAPPKLSELIRLMGSFTVIDSHNSPPPGRGSNADRPPGGTIFNNRTQCPPAVYVDGQLLSFHAPGESPRMTAFEAVNSVHWSDVEGIEVYSGVSTVPAIFSGSRAGCGVIAIWLRRGP